MTAHPFAEFAVDTLRDMPGGRPVGRLLANVYTAAATAATHVVEFVSQSVIAANQAHMISAPDTYQDTITRYRFPAVLPVIQDSVIALDRKMSEAHERGEHLREKIDRNRQWAVTRLSAE